MQNESGLSRADRELEAAMSALRPRMGGVDRDGMMFRAGLAVGGRNSKAWRVVCAALTVMLVGSVALRPWFRAGRDDVRIVSTTQPIEHRGGSYRPYARDVAGRRWEDREGAGSYVRLRDAVLERGVDALDEGRSSSGRSAAPLTREELLENMLSS